MEIKYTRKGDYLLPNLYLEKDEECGRIGKYGILRLHFIAQNKQALYETLLMTNKLTHHLLLVSDSCESLYKILMDDYIKNDERLPEKNKELNQEIKKIKDRNINLNKFAILEEQLKMREYIKEKNLFNGFDEENLMIVLEKCGFKPNKIDEEEAFETIANTNITNEEDKQNSEQKEIDEVMREIEDLI